MTYRDKSFTPCLCASITLHGLALTGIAWWYVETNPSPHLPPLDKVMIRALVLSKAELPKLQPPPQAQQMPPPPKPAPKPKQAKKPPEKFEKPPEPTHDDSGEHDGVGTANRSTPGKDPMKANLGLEQADLMKDAVKFVADAVQPSRKGGLQNNNAEKQTSPPPGVVLPDTPVEQKPVAITAAIAPISPQPEKSPGPGPASPVVKAEQLASGTNAPVANVPISQKATPKPMQREVLGHEATRSDSESLAFAKAEHSEFKAGKLEGRKGLKTRTTIPHLGEAAQHDLEMMGNLHIVLGVTVDADGAVQNVEVLESSGSENIDQDFKLEVYNHWNLEPRKDAEGHPVDLNWVVTCT